MIMGEAHARCFSFGLGSGGGGVGSLAGQAGERVEVLRTALLDAPAAVPDPRDPRGVRCSVMALLAIAILATAMRALVALEPPQRTAR